MKTAVIRVDEPRAGGPPNPPFPVQIFIDDGAPGWWKRSVALAEIPADLHVDPPVMQPGEAAPVDDAYCVKVLQSGVGPSPGLQRAGEYLAQLLLTGAVGQAWRKIERPVRTVLDLKPRKLQQLPWELLCAANNVRPFMQDTTPIIRGEIDWTAPPPPAIDWPVRVLVVIGVRADDQKIGWLEELDHIEDAFSAVRHLVDYEVLPQPSREEIVTAYRALKPHVFHFIGHGRIVDGKGQLDLWDADAGEARPWPADDIINRISTEQAPPPRLCVLNACRTAAGAPLKDAFAVAHAFARTGALAVIGMQGDIRGRAAAACARTFYAAIAGGASVDVALARARNDMTLPTGYEIDTRDWALPTIMVSVPPSHVLPVKLTIDPDVLQKIQGASEFQDVRDSVDRSGDRRRLWETLFAGKARNVLILSGTAEIGKTDLLRWVLEGCALRGHRVSYVQLDPKRRFNFLEVLRFIKDGDPNSDSLVRQPLDLAAFSRLNRDLNLLLEGKPPPPDPPAELVPDAGLPLRPGIEALVKTIFERFRAALVDVARAQPLIIALDQADRVEEANFRDFLLPYLLRPVARGEVPNVRMLLAVRGNVFEDYGLKAFSAQSDVLTVDLIAQKLFQPAARRLLRHYNKGDDKDMLDVVSAVAKTVKGPWSPSTLMAIRLLLKR